MVVLAEIGIERHITQHVVHPAHVPLVVKPQSAVTGRAGDHRPGGGFLGDHQGVGMRGKYPLIEALQELHRLEVLMPAVLIWHPLAVPAVVIEIQH